MVLLQSDLRSVIQIAARSIYFFNLTRFDSRPDSHAFVRPPVRFQGFSVSARIAADKPTTCTADELHYVSVHGSDWRLALWRYKPPPEAPRNHPLLILSGVGTNAIGFDLSPNAVSLFFLAAYYKFLGGYPLVAVGALLLYVGCYQISFGPISWLMVSEIFPIRTRGKGISLAVLTNFGSNAIVALALLADYVDKDDFSIRIGAIMGLALAYAGSQNEQASTSLYPPC